MHAIAAPRPALHARPALPVRRAPQVAQATSTPSSSTACSRLEWLRRHTTVLSVEGLSAGSARAQQLDNPSSAASLGFHLLYDIVARQNPREYAVSFRRVQEIFTRAAVQAPREGVDAAVGRG